MNNGDVGRGRGRGWQQIESQPRELRRPRIAEDAKEAPKSKLSAEAKEWYPANYTPQAPPAAYGNTDPSYRLPRFSVQDRLRQAQDSPYNFNDMSYTLNEQENVNMRRKTILFWIRRNEETGGDLTPHHRHLYQRATTAEQDGAIVAAHSANPFHSTALSAADYNESIANLITVMCEITFDPGKFDILCGPLVDSFASTLHDAAYTRPLVEAIVNQSIAEPNFRYNGARLCSMYDSVAAPDESTFRACLLERCNVEENKIISGVETSDEYMRGFAMFLAEIYTQLEDSQGGRIKTLGESLCKVLLHLLDTENEINIKAVCQLLKLSGIALDADCAGGMAVAFERLRRASSLACVRAVLALRAARWGLLDSHHDTVSNGSSGGGGGGGGGGNSGTETAGAGDSSEGYLADGHALSPEERAFLQTHLPPQQKHDTIEELDDEVWDMDAEMQAGFMEFLRMSNQIKR